MSYSIFAYIRLTYMFNKATYLLNSRSITFSGIWPNLKQDAQLSQRDRATAAWVSFGQNITEKYSAPNLIGLSSTMHCDIIGFLIYRIRWNNAKWGLLRRSRSFKVTNLGTNRKSICDFIL